MAFSLSFSSVFGGAGRALRHPVYRRFWFGHSLAAVGRWMKRTAVGWLTWELTESTSWLGIVAFADLVPMMLFVILSGAIADRVGLMRIVRLSQVLSGLRLGLAPAGREGEETHLVESYEAYAKGVINLRVESPESLDRAILFFERAIGVELFHQRLDVAGSLIGRNIPPCGGYGNHIQTRIAQGETQSHGIGNARVDIKQYLSRHGLLATIVTSETPKVTRILQTAAAQYKQRRCRFSGMLVLTTAKPQAGGQPLAV